MNKSSAPTPSNAEPGGAANAPQIPAEGAAPRLLDALQAAHAGRAAAAELEAIAARAEKALEALAKAKASAGAQVKAMRESVEAASARACAAALRERGSTTAVKFIDVDLAAPRGSAKAAELGLAVGEELELRPEPTNPADPDAVRVLRAGKPVCYLSRESAQAVKAAVSGAEGWALTGRAFLKSKTGGKWNQGTAKARLESPVMGWEGFNPTRSLGDNLARLEAELLAAATAPADGSAPAQASDAPRRKARSL